MPKGSIEWEYDTEEGLTLHIKPVFRKLVLGEAGAHVRASRKEMLMAFRSLIDAAIKGAEEKEKAPRKYRTKIKIE
jgi:hypothetical protein